MQTVAHRPVVGLGEEVGLVTGLLVVPTIQVGVLVSGLTMSVTQFSTDSESRESV